MTTPSLPSATLTTAATGAAATVFVGSDHGGFKMKSDLTEYLRTKYSASASSPLKLNVVDLGCPDENSVDYPDIAESVCAKVLSTVLTAKSMVMDTNVFNL